MEASYIWSPVGRCLPSVVTVIAISRTGLGLEKLPRILHHVRKKAQINVLGCGSSSVGRVIARLHEALV